MNHDMEVLLPSSKLAEIADSLIKVIRYYGLSPFEATNALLSAAEYVADTHAGDDIDFNKLLAVILADRRAEGHAPGDAPLITDNIMTCRGDVIGN